MYYIHNTKCKGSHLHPCISHKHLECSSLENKEKITIPPLKATLLFTNKYTASALFKFILLLSNVFN